MFGTVHALIRDILWHDNEKAKGDDEKEEEEKEKKTKLVS